jgi:hypothetical protein
LFTLDIGEERMKINTGCWVDGCKRFDPEDEDGVWIRKDRDWVSLTDDEINEIAVKDEHEILSFARAIEAELKEKNHG